jgi:hypothetical protein
MSNEDLIAFLKKNVISVTCVLVSIALGVVWYLRSDLLPEAEAVLLQKTKDGELLAANIDDSDKLKEQQAALVASNKAIADRMIKVGQLAENLQYFYQLESDTSTKLADPRQIPWTPPSKTAPKTNYTPVGFSISAQGEYPKLMDLLRRLEHGEHYCRVLTCTIHPQAEQRGGQLLMQLNLELLGFQ